ncbi:hypothetical protein GGS21DRAFT_410568 [Xylaria nigripes]|nr:hypothetical protein GGS21DRAFT_410568 [Xylaria nigripes]
MVLHDSHSQNPINGVPSRPVDPYVHFEMFAASRLERTTMPSRPAIDGYSDFSEFGGFYSETKNGPSPDPKPEDVFVGCINPFALAENLIGHKIDRQSVTAIQTIQNTLQTDYEELFDMKHQSVLYAGLKLNNKTRMAEEFPEKDMKILKERHLITPDLSHLQRLGDLEQIGLENMGDMRIKRAGIQNNKLHLVLHADKIVETVCNNAVTQAINDICLPFGRENSISQRGSLIPLSSSWRDAREVVMMRNVRRGLLSDDDVLFRTRELQTVHKFDDPVQGATGNSWFVAALFSVSWAEPAIINRNTRLQMQMPYDIHSDEHYRFSVKFYDKGGRHNNKTQTVQVDYHVPVNNASEDFIYCRSSNGIALWPALYEKAFAKWANNGNNNYNANTSNIYINWCGLQQIDITKIHNGDPVKAMAQINGREPLYYFTRKHDARDLIALVRVYCINHRTIYPMVAWTYASDGDAYHGCNLVANHAYSVLGWSSFGQSDKQYIIIRNPWGVTEPHGLTSYFGLLTDVKPEHWSPASLLDREGVMAVEVGAFKEYFACMGVAK